MNLQLHVRNNDFAEALQTYLERRLQLALRSFADQIGLVTVRLADGNGPRGKRPSQCEITAELVPGGNVVARETNPDLYIAVDRAVRKLAHLLRKQCDRKRRPRPHVGDRFCPHDRRASSPRLMEGGQYAGVL